MILAWLHRPVSLVGIFDDATTFLVKVMSLHHTG
jgi:hypothetical protein